MIFALLLTCLFVNDAPATQPAVRTCEMCNGDGYVPCTNPKCDEGDIPCPKPCLKLSQGQWYVKDGLHWRKFPMKGGSYEFSEHHLGQIVTPPKGDAGPSAADCPTCKGSTRVTCPTCDGTDIVACPKCKGAGEVAAPVIKPAAMK